MNTECRIEYAKRIFDEEIGILTDIRNNLDDMFSRIEEKIISCKGKVILCGMGKSGHVARKCRICAVYFGRRCDPERQVLSEQSGQSTVCVPDWYRAY